MQLTCPNCGTHVPADKVNIQQMVAVCPSCDSVFKFEPPQEKIKRRKVKPPPQLIVPETDGDTHLAFRTNFRLDRSENFISYTILSLSFTVITVLMLTKFQASNTTGVIVTGVFALISLLLYYGLALMAYNKTHIEMDDTRITVSRKPLPNPFNHTQDIGLAGVVAIRCEETPISKEKGFDTPRNNVWAETEDARRKMIVTDVTEDYALFITQYLNEHLELADDVDVTHLTDNEAAADHEQLSNSLVQTRTLEQ
ncbi:MAG: hypothetical protein R3E39_08320 [Anaerolineae bacterium]